MKLVSEESHYHLSDNKCRWQRAGDTRLNQSRQSFQSRASTRADWPSNNNSHAPSARPTAVMPSTNNVIRHCCCCWRLQRRQLERRPPLPRVWREGGRKCAIKARPAALNRSIDRRLDRPTRVSRTLSLSFGSFFLGRRPIASATAAAAAAAREANRQAT